MDGLDHTTLSFDQDWYVPSYVEEWHDRIARVTPNSYWYLDDESKRLDLIQWILVSDKIYKFGLNSPYLEDLLKIKKGKMKQCLEEIKKDRQQWQMVIVM
jgi:hypothetical protein